MLYQVFGWLTIYYCLTNQEFVKNFILYLLNECTFFSAVFLITRCFLKAFSIHIKILHDCYHFRSFIFHS